MSNAPLISIITVTFNAVTTLGVTIDSVMEQSFTDFEHIIADGASSDGTPGLARSKGDARTRVFSSPDKGLYDAMNKALGYARGQYVIFLNAGDTFHSPASLARFARGASQGADIIYADTVLVDNGRNFIAPRHLSAPRRLTKASFSRGMLICHQAFMVRRDIAPAYDMKYRFSADYDWTIRCISATRPERCHNIGSVEIDYLSEGLTTANHKASLRERFDIMRRHYGLPITLWRHFTFIFRAAARKLHSI